MHIKIEHIAKVCHEANKAYCESIGDYSQFTWSDAPEWQRLSSIEGVEFAVANPDAPQSAQHEAWMSSKLAQGWVHGEVKDAAARTHPCLVPYDMLPPEQQAKDALFIAIVNSLKHMVD